MWYLTFIFLLYAFALPAQHNQANIWYFGNGNGLDFSTNPPKAISNGVFQRGRISSICDNNGKLLFYTDGMTVIDKNHTIMKNGVNLLGQAESVIVPFPNKKDLYYIFTISMNPDMKTLLKRDVPQLTDEEFMKTLIPLTEQEIKDIEKKGKIINQKNAYLYYHIVDMSKNNGLGEVTEKNKFIYPKIKAELVVARHANNKDYWLITHEFMTNKFKVFLINENGLQKPAIETNVGMKLTNEENLAIWYHLNSQIFSSQMSISAQFDKISLYDGLEAEVQIFNFDNTTGKIQLDTSHILPVVSNMVVPFVMSMEFSPDGTKLYALTICRTEKRKERITILYQYDLIKNGKTRERIFRYIDANNPKVDSIKASSPKNVFWYNDENATLKQNNPMDRGMRLASDGKIYFSQNKHIGFIENPNDTLEAIKIKNDLHKYFPALGNSIPKIAHLLPSSYSYPPIKSGDIFQREILFETGKYDLKEYHYPILGDIVQFLKENPKTNITISGHTDNEGNPQANKILSENRAKAVKNYLISQKIDKNRITSQGFGDTKPLLDNSTPENKRKNRRIEFLVE